MPIVHPENLIQLSANPLGSGFRYTQASCVKLSWDAFQYVAALTVIIMQHGLGHLRTS